MIADEGDDDPDLFEMEKTIKEIVGGPIITSVNGFFDSEIYLANSWLGSIHSYVRKQQGDTLHTDRPSREKRERLVGIANRLDVDVETLLEAEPREEVRLIHDALLECERTGYELPN